MHRVYINKLIPRSLEVRQSGNCCSPQHRTRVRTNSKIWEATPSAEVFAHRLATFFMSGRSVFLHRLRRASSLLVSCRVRVVVFGRGGEGDRKGEMWGEKESSLVVSVVGRSKEKCGACGAGCGGMPAAEPDGGAHSSVRSGRGDAPPQTRSTLSALPRGAQGTSAAARNLRTELRRELQLVLHDNSTQPRVQCSMASLAGLVGSTMLRTSCRAP